jgi:hypothetical protein
MVSAWEAVTASVSRAARRTQSLWKAGADDPPQPVQMCSSLLLLGPSGAIKLLLHSKKYTYVKFHPLLVSLSLLIKEDLSWSVFVLGINKIFPTTLIPHLLSNLNPSLIQQLRVLVAHSLTMWIWHIPERVYFCQQVSNQWLGLKPVL